MAAARREKPENKPVVIVTGSNGFLGSATIKKLAQGFTVIGFDRDLPPHPPAEAECVCVDLTSDDSVDAAFDRVRAAYGDKMASVVHLAALRRRPQGVQQLRCRRSRACWAWNTSRTLSSHT